MLLAEHLTGELAIVLGRSALGVVGEDRGVAGSFTKLRVLADDGLKDKLRKPLSDPPHDVVAPIGAAIEAAAEDAGKADVRVEPLTNHLDVAEELGKPVHVENARLHRHDDLCSGI